MRRDTRPAGRAGFTLIELLIVIAILALLAALVAAGIGRVKDAQQARVTDQTLMKLQLAVDQQWKAICEQSHNDRRDFEKGGGPQNFKNLVAFCGNDKDTAESLWMYLNLRRSMPQTFEEAKTRVEIPSVLKLEPDAAFGRVPASATDPNDPNRYKESAVLLYMILDRGARGTTFALDDATQGAQTTLAIGGGSFPAFRDSYGAPIAFRRFYQQDELDLPPYAQVAKFTDTLDPYGKLVKWSTSPNGMAAVKAVFGTPAPSASPPPGRSASSFDGKNKIATVISAGPDSRNLSDDKKAAAFTSGVTDGEDTTMEDNAYGYRLTRQGNKGD